MARKNPTGIDLQGTGKIVNLVDGSAATDAVTLQQLQAAIRGLDWKPSVRVAVSGNVTLTAPGATLDGVTMANGESFLALGQTTASQNGIYTYNGAASAATRRNDADSSAEVTGGMAVTATEGTTNGDKTFVLTTNDPITLDTTALVFTQLGGGINYTNGNGLQLSGNAFAILLDSGSGLVVSGTGLKIDSTYSGFIKRYAVDVPSGSTTATITHNLGTVDRAGEPLVTIKSTGEVIEVDILLGTTTDTLTFAVAPTSGQYRYSTAA